MICAAGAKMTAANVLKKRGVELFPEEAADILKSDSATSIMIPPTSPEVGHVYLFKPYKKLMLVGGRITHAISTVNDIVFLFQNKGNIIRFLVSCYAL